MFFGRISGIRVSCCRRIDSRPTIDSAVPLAIAVSRQFAAYSVCPHDGHRVCHISVSIFVLNFLRTNWVLELESISVVENFRLLR